MTHPAVNVDNAIQEGKKQMALFESSCPAGFHTKFFRYSYSSKVWFYLCIVPCKSYGLLCVFVRYVEGSTEEGRDKGVSRVHTLHSSTRLPPEKVTKNKMKLIDLMTSLWIS